MLLYSNNEYIISDINAENIDGEMIIIDSALSLIITLNHTATTIYQYLKDNNSNKTILEIDDIVKRQLELYDLSVEEKGTVVIDTVEAIEKMIELNILEVINKDI